MNTASSLLKHWCRAGVVTITLLGFVWHYAYGWSGANHLLGALVPVNESVWEHLKMGYWGLVLFSAVEYFYVRRRARNYFWAKLSGVLALEVCILALHYASVALAGHLVLWVDIVSFVLGAALCQYLAYRVYLAPQQRARNEVLALAGFVALGFVLIIATYYPPHYEIFRDQNDNTTGIHKKPY